MDIAQRIARAPEPFPGAGGRMGMRRRRELTEDQRAVRYFVRCLAFFLACLALVAGLYSVGLYH